MVRPAITVAVGAVIEDGKGRILLVKHVPERGGYWQGKWICPGGRLEPGETIKEGIRREVKEETQLEIDFVAPLYAFERIVHDKEKLTLHVIYIDWLVKLTEGKLKPGSDVGQAKWVKKENIAAMWSELHDDTKRLLQIAELVGPEGAAL